MDPSHVQHWKKHCGRERATCGLGSTYIPLQSVQKQLEVSDSGICHRYRNRCSSGFARVSLVVELDSDASKIFGNLVDVLLLSGFLGNGGALPLIWWRKDSSHNGDENG